MVRHSCLRCVTIVFILLVLNMLLFMTGVHRYHRGYGCCLVYSLVGDNLTETARNDRSTPSAAATPLRAIKLGSLAMLDSLSTPLATPLPISLATPLETPLVRHNITDSELHVTVKTTASSHSTRLPLLARTWIHTLNSGQVCLMCDTVRHSLQLVYNYSGVCSWSMDCCISKSAIFPKGKHHSCGVYLYIRRLVDFSVMS